MDLEGADTELLAGGEQFQALAVFNMARPEGACNNGSKPLLGKGAVHRQPAEAGGGALGDGGGYLVQKIFQIVNVAAGEGGHVQNRGVLQCGM